jgi:hypothetical protein
VRSFTDGLKGRDKFSTAQDADNARQRAVPTILARISGET